MSTSSAGTRCEQKVFQNRYNRKTDRTEVVEVPTLSSESLDEQQRQRREYALIVEEVYDSKHERANTILTVNSPFILSAFRHVVGSHPTVASDFSKPVELQSPFQMLIHAWDKLEAYRDETDDDHVRMHMHLLFDFMKAELGADRERILTMVAKRQISFKTAWAIFVPGELVLCMDAEHPFLLRLAKTAYEDYAKVGPVCHVYGNYTDSNGKVTGEAEHRVDVLQKRIFGGDHPANITDIPIYPLKFWEGDAEALQKRLTERGKKLLGIKGVCFKHYTGIAKYLKTPPWDYYESDLEGTGGYWVPFMETSRIVLDRALCEKETYLEKTNIKATATVDPMLCAPYAFGYSPTKKEWAKYYVDQIAEIEWKPSPWDSLMLPQEQKRVLKALVECHNFPSNPHEEAEQKGKGLVILLHGSPGSGKTLTAESSAEAAKRILITASLGELDRDNRAASFEYRLKELLRFATAWGAVLLLDEADVFLERREESAGSERKNALVAVFLRNLEYFSGIVFLTTNRIRAFDAAMKSRVHLALGYAPPGIGTRQELWATFLRRVPEEERELDLEEDLDELVRDRLNGREIAYIVHTARTIARSEGAKLGLGHLMTVLEVRREFDASLKRTARAEVENASFHEGGGGLVRRADSILFEGGGGES
ncbi:P-loop containing nucleoside triphosphate hydrolase protein [Podospora conica]|nr:P-loop containing nucleoside triphosphate hydrolase protein [Schizothecium conicum]